MRKTTNKLIRIIPAAVLVTAGVVCFFFNENEITLVVPVMSLGIGFVLAGVLDFCLEHFWK